MGKDFIEPKDQVEIPFRIKICMKKKLTCVYTCICSSTAINGDWRFKNLTEFALDYFLHTVNFWLFLPSVVTLAMVGNMEEVSQVFV